MTPRRLVGSALRGGRALLERHPLTTRFMARRDLTARSHLRDVGWFQSYRTKLPVDASGEPLPWFTYPAIAVLAERVHSDMVVFEFGSGNSTRWWARRVRRVVSVEHDAEWCRRVRADLPVNVELEHVELVEDGEYCRSASRHAGPFDVVVVDGRDRVNCAKQLLGALAPDGVVVWDNSDRTEYQEGYDVLTSAGFKRLDFHGMGPINAPGWCTSVFYREPNCLGL